MPPLYFDMTVLEYLKFVADLKKIPKDKKATMIEEIMDMVVDFPAPLGPRKP